MDMEEGEPVGGNRWCGWLEDLTGRGMDNRGGGVRDTERRWMVWTDGGLG